jgi:hypothetical protein
MLGVLLAVDLLISANLRRQQSRMMGGWSDIYSGKIDCDIVINGASRAIYQYNPAILDSILGTSTYNLGIDGSGINRQILKYNTYRRYNSKPKFIIQDISVLTFVKRNAYEVEQFFPYFYDDSLRNAVCKIDNLDFKYKYFPFYRYIGHYEFILKGCGLYKNNKEMVNGYVGSYKSKWNGTLLEKINKIEFERDSLSFIQFDEYLQKAKSENIQVIFVYAPLYMGAVERIEDIDLVYATFNNFAEKFNIPILDFTYDSLSYDTAYFYNSTHLTGQGADLFSIKLANAIDSLGLIK